MSLGFKLSLRSPRLSYGSGTELYWFAGNPYLSHLIHALSFLFPPGEEAFVRSVQRLRHHVKDPNLAKEIDTFIAQESLHGAQHKKLNRWLAAHNPKVEAYTHAIQNAIQRDFKRLDTHAPKLSLAITVALEHLTAAAASALLGRPWLLNQMQEPMRSLLVWHAIEEIEHRSLAFEVYQAAGGGYMLRLLAMLFATVMLVTETIRYQTKLLAHDQQLTNLEAWWEMMRTLFGAKGYAWGLILPYLSYWTPWFHPHQGCQHISVEHWQETLRLTPDTEGVA